MSSMNSPTSSHLDQDMETYSDNDFGVHAIKEEDQPENPFKQGEIVNLLSDDDSEGQPTIQTKRTLKGKGRKQTKVSATSPNDSPMKGQISTTETPVNSKEDDERPSRATRGMDPAGASFEADKKVYLKRKRASTLSIEEEIEWMKREAEEAARMRKLKADEDFDRTPTPRPNEGGLFMSEEEAFTPTFLSDADEDRPKKKAKKDRPSKVKAKVKVKKIPGTDYTAAEAEAVLNKAKKAMKTPKSKDPKPKKKQGAAITNVASIMGTNVFKDVAATAHLPSQPIIDREALDKDNKKNSALKQLLASVPRESARGARADRKLLDDSLKAFTGKGSIMPAEDGGWLVKGMKSSIKHFQVLGVAFMRNREQSQQLPRGGILGDEMGLGKTVMMLANVVNGRSRDRSPRKATLIVASPALLAQWAAEIRTHCASVREDQHHGIGRVMQYRSGTRLDSNDIESILQNSDIVLTTYHEILKSYPKQVFPAELVTSEQKKDWWARKFENERGPLHRVTWLRVCLDEAQAIKNHNTWTSKAARALDSRFRWCITGTPVLNTIREFYAYFRFLREPSTGSYRIFSQNFDPEHPDGFHRLTVFLQKFMIRRTHLDRLFEAKLLDLPQPKQQTIWLRFNEVEAAVYHVVKSRFIERINSIAHRGNLDRSYKYVWSMILRLRQLTAHILLIQQTCMDLLDRADYEKLRSLTEDEDNFPDDGSALLAQLRRFLNHAANTQNEESNLVENVITETSALPSDFMSTDQPDYDGYTGGVHGIRFPFKKYLDAVPESPHGKRIDERTECCSCHQMPKDPHITSCFHIYCLSCLKDLQHQAARKGQDHAKCVKSCGPFTDTRPCQELATMPDPERTSGSSTPHIGAGRTRGKKKDGRTDSWIELNGQVLPSTKTRAAKAQILNWLEKDPSVKVIVYTQWLDMIRVLERVCQTERWGFCKYTGQMSHDHREKALAEFRDNPEKKILLASLKCGGLGLNLVAASKVITLDPYWNLAVEKQAFSRVFRIGQQKETEMVRFLVKDTIDAAIHGIQERKKIEIDEVMDQHSKAEPLSIRDLMRMFGSVVEADDGKPFIFAEGADQYDEDEHLRPPDLGADDEEGVMGDEE